MICIHADADYTRISIVDKKDELMLRTLKKWEAILPEKHFVRIHRSTIINMEYVDKVEKTTSNRSLIYLHHVSSPVLYEPAVFRFLEEKVIGCRVI